MGANMKILEMLAYSQYLRHSYLDTFSRLPWDEFVKNRGASFGSMKNIFLHSIEVLDYLVNHLIQGDTNRQKIDFDAFNSFESISDYLETVEFTASDYLSKITPEDLSRKHERKFPDGTVIQTTVEDTLIHLFQEETHHRGEFIALLWQMGIEPPHLGWAKYINM